MREYWHMNNSIIIAIILVISLIISGAVSAFLMISDKNNTITSLQFKLDQANSEINVYQVQIEKMKAQVRNYIKQNVGNDSECKKELEQTKAMNLKLQQAQTLVDAKVSAENNDPKLCALPPAKRSCAKYNIQYLLNQKYICPNNYTLIDGYPPGGLTGPVCHMNSGGEGTPKTCQKFTDPGCDPNATVIPCYGRWSCSKYPCYNYYGSWYVVKAMPASEVCGE